MTGSRPCARGRRRSSGATKKSSCCGALGAGKRRRRTGGAVSGEPGIGKSRLTAELSERIDSEPHTRIRYFCSPHHQDSALYPFIIQLERAAGFALDDAVEQKLDKLQELLAPAKPRDERLLCWQSCCRCRAPPLRSISVRSASARCCLKRCCTNLTPWAGTGPF